MVFRLLLAAAALFVWSPAQVHAQARPTTAQAEAGDSMFAPPQQVLPTGARIYVAPMSNGFEMYVVAGFQKKKVPLVVVAVRDKADFELTGVSETDKAGWARILFLGNDSTNETASVKIVNLKSGEVVFAYSVNKGQSARGKQSAGEAVAKHVKKKIENPSHGG